MQDNINLSADNSALQTSKNNNEHVDVDEKAQKRKKIIIIGVVAALLVALIIILSITLSGGDTFVPHPKGPPKPAFAKDPDTPVNHLQVADATNSQDTYSGYISQGTPSQAQLSQLMSQLQSAAPGANHDFGINGRTIPTGPNNNFIQNISFEFNMPSYKIAHLRMADANNLRYEVPNEAAGSRGADSTMRLEMLGFNLTTSPFSFSFSDVTDKSNILISTVGSSMVFMDKFIQMDFQLPSQRVFGLGERVHEFQLGEGTWTMWAKGQDNVYDDGTGGKQSYGMHPFILVQGKNKGDFVGMWFRNSNAQSPLLKYKADGTSTLSYITTGGILDVYFYVHGSAKEMIQQYQYTIGTPNLPPFWSLGWQQGSEKYTTQDTIKTVMNNYYSAGLPLETIYLDESYLAKNQNYMVDTNAFPTIQTFAQNVHDNKQHIVVMVNAGLSADATNDNYYQSAHDANSLIKSSVNPSQVNGDLSNQATSDHTVFFDWFNPNTTSLFTSSLSDLYTQIPFDGLWLSMNEATGKCDGECPTITQLSEEVEKRRLESNDVDASWYSSYLNQGQMSSYFLPFIPGTQNLDQMALSLNGTHDNGETEYNLHNLYGHMQSKAAMSYFTQDERPFIISRSTAPGSGKYASHWLGNTNSDASQMKFQIANIMNMQMFGIQQTGGDVCGSQASPRSDDLCSRWIQLATFFPVARHFYTSASDPLEPFNLVDPYLTIAKDSMFDRYQYLRHMYTCLFEASQWGTTCFDPLFYYYPTDDKCFTDIESSFMVGSAIKVSPILTTGVATGDTFTSYFPGTGSWVNLADYTEVIPGGTTATLKARTTVNAHLRPGALISFQDNSGHVYYLTEGILTAPIQLIVNRDESGAAEGTVLLDGGVSRSEIWDNNYEYLQFKYSSNTLNKLFGQGKLGSQDTVFQKLVILNAEDLANTDFACYLDSTFNPHLLQYSYDDVKKTLTIAPNDIGASVEFNDFSSIHFGDASVDINLCSAERFNYNLRTGVLPDLSGSSASFNLYSNAPLVLPQVTVKLQMIQNNIVNVMWTYKSQPGSERIPFQVPKNIINPLNSKPTTSLSSFVTITDQPFTLSINSVEGTKVFDIEGLVFSAWLNIVKSKAYLAEGDDFQGIFGLGERVSSLLTYQDGVYSMFARDAGTPTDHGTVPGSNVYGVHPFYMFKTDSAVWTGVYTNLAQAQDWYIQNDPYSGFVDLTSVAIGGVTDLYVIIGSSPKGIVSDYWNYIVGKPVLVPAFSLGWNQCRWGYHTTQDLMDVIGNYSQYNLPLDVQWSDIDYLDTYRDFTYDMDRFADLPKFIDSLHENNMYYVPIIDAGIAARPNSNYSAYDSGVEQNIFVKSSQEQMTSDFIGMVWPNEAVYPDWFNSKAGQWWQDQLAALHSSVAFDGLWLDMNEASNFCNGPCSFKQVPSSSVLANLKYIPSNRDLNIKAISVDAYHATGILELDTHSLFGTHEVMNSHLYFQKNNKRTFIIERSSAAGMGKYGSRWLGDNQSDLEHLENSITGIMMMGIFGMPLNGVDICGFGGDTTPELCARWTVIGAFYPFSRNHNAYTSKSQEPYVFANDRYEEGISYTDIMRVGIRNKYHLIKYYYTQMFLGSIYGTGPLWNPMFFEFPDDNSAYVDAQYNIMLGPALKLSVNSNKLNQNSTQFYFPAGTWCNVWNHSEPCMNNAKGSYPTLRTKAYDFYVHIRDGNIVPLQNATKLNVNTTAQLQQSPIDLHILGTPNKGGEAWYAAGTYINDDGLNLTTQGNYNHYAMAAYGNITNPGVITIEFTMYYSAFNYLNKLQTGCSAVNMNDFLGDIYIYNGKKLGATGSFIIIIYFKDGSASQVQTVDYNAQTDMVVWINNLTSSVCLTNVDRILINKYA